MGKLLARLLGFSSALQNIIMGHRRMVVNRQPNTRRIYGEDEPETFARIIHVTFKPNFLNSREKASKINRGLSKVATTTGLGGERTAART
jgi:hypothetical protein